MLFVSDDWAEAHHDIEIVDELGRRLTKRRLPEGLDGVSRLHALIAANYTPTSSSWLNLIERWFKDHRPAPTLRRVHQRRRPQPGHHHLGRALERRP